MPAKQCRPICPYRANWPALVSLKLKRPSWKLIFKFNFGFLLLNLIIWKAEWRGRIFLSFKIEVAKSGQFYAKITRSKKGKGKYLSDKTLTLGWKKNVWRKKLSCLTRSNVIDCQRYLRKTFNLKKSDNKYLKARTT